MMQKAKESVRPPAKASLKCPNCRATVFEKNITSLANLEVAGGPVLHDWEKLAKEFNEMDPGTPADVVKLETETMEDAILQCMATDNPEMAVSRSS
jgi:hypothetical protein